MFRSKSIENVLTLSDRQLESVLQKAGFARRKASRALVLLKNHGVHFRTLEEFLLRSDIQKGVPLLPETCASQEMYESLSFITPVFKCQLRELSKDACLTEEIPDSIWLRAIELAVFLGDPLVVRSQDWLGAAEGFALWIVLLVFLLVCSGQKDLVHREKERLWEQERVSLLAQVASLEKDRARVEAIGAEQKVERERLEKQRNELRATIFEAERPLLKQIEEQAAEIQRLQDLLAVSSEVGVDAGSVTIPEVDEELVDLPDEGVMFVGGHPRVVNKLTSLFPKWRFVSADDSSVMVGASTDFIFIHSAHISHKLCNSCVGNASVPYFYVNDTNLDLLLLSMRRQLTSYVLKGD